MFELSPEQRQELGGPEPARAVDPQTNQTYVLVPSDVYDRLKILASVDDIDPEAMYPLLADLAPEDWEDPSVYGIPCKP